MIAYSDKYDGRIQVSFTLQGNLGHKARDLGLLYCKRLGLTEVDVVSFKSVSGFTCYIAYGNSPVEVFEEEIQTLAPVKYTKSKIEKDLEGKNLVLVGATLESDAHTVGLDAILSMKGYNGDYGLERYECFDVVNMGAQVTVKELIDMAIKVKANYILISQTVSQNHIHIKHLQDLKVELDAKGLKIPVIIGGMHVSNELALDLGFAAGFGRGTSPLEVASLIRDLSMPLVVEQKLKIPVLLEKATALL